jgi:RNA polymerase sigma factor (sigma-70 family)
LFVIAHNSVIDVRRGQRQDDPLEAAAAIIDPVAPPEDQAIAAIDLARFDDAFERLSTDDRQILELRRAGLSGREIAAALFVSPKTIEKHVALLRDKLSEPSRAAAVAVAIRTALI